GRRATDQRRAGGRGGGRAAAAQVAEPAAAEGVLRAVARGRRLEEVGARGRGAVVLVGQQHQAEQRAGAQEALVLERLAGVEGAPRFDETTPTRRSGSPPGAPRSARTSAGKPATRACCLGPIPWEVSTTKRRSTWLLGCCSMRCSTNLVPDAGPRGSGWQA